ncbi:MAG: S8 family serine peptidase, partial [Candidatus Sericytochromatia bacterium]|nr:S8 family serine peptidase [Candidatus Sericytochromatia bacterium]
ANLDRASVKFFFGTTEMAVSNRKPNMVTLTLPAGSAKSGQLSVRDGSATVYRLTSVDSRSPYTAGRLLIRFRDGAPRATVESAMQAAGITYYRYPGMNYLVASHNPDVSFDTVATRLKANAVFDQVSREAIFSTKGAPEDARYPEQWALPRINAPAAWDISKGSPDVVVAVLDTGIQTNHPDLATNIYVSPGETAGNNVDDDRNGRVDDVRGWNAYDQNGLTEDDNGHGTQVAGVIAAVQDKVGVTGLAPLTRILPVKVSNSSGLATSASLIDGINYAVRNRASVICMSIGANIDDPAVRDAVSFATTFNVTVAAPMGNEGTNLRQYPAAWSNQLNLLAVGATNSTDSRAAWSNFGDWMTVSAPGDSILTTTLGSGYGVVSGTSFAAAHVAGQAALIKSLKPSWSPTMLRSLIVSTAVDKGVAGFDTYFGNGRITMDSNTMGNLLGLILDDMGVRVSSEHEAGRTPADMAVDKNSETLWSSARTAEMTPQFMRLDMGQSSRLTSIAALPAGHYSYLFPASFTIELSNDDVTWRPVIQQTNFRIPESTWHRWNITPTQARYVRFNITETRKNTDNALHYAQIAEVAFNGEENNVVMNSSSVFYGSAYPSAFLTDGKNDTMWVSTVRGTSQREFAIADLKVNRTFRSIKLLSPPEIISGAFPKAIDFYTSNDKVNWTYVKSFRGLTSLAATWYTFAVPETSGRYIRIDVPETNTTSSKGALYSGNFANGFFTSIAEVSVE